METKGGGTEIPAGVRYARWAGFLFGVFLTGFGGYLLFRGPGGGFDAFKAGFYVIYGLLNALPFRKFGALAWKTAYGCLLVFSVAFVFLLIASVLFAYVEAAERGERLGVPGFEGTLIFLALLQVPAVLFERRPELLD